MPSIKIENPFLVSCLNSPWTSSKRSLFSQSKRLQPIDSPPSTSMGFGGPCYAGLSHPRRSKNSECSNCQVPGSRAVAHEPVMIGWWLDENILGSSIFASYASVFFLESCSNNKWIGFLAFLEKKFGVWNILLWICWSHLFYSRYYSDFNNSSTHFSWKMLWSCMQL